MTTIKTKLVPFIVLITVGFTLLNSNAFGASTLISFFLFSFLTGIIGFLFFGSAFFRIGKLKYEIPVFLLIFLVLGLYVFLHGVINQHISLTHIYWISCAIFLFTINVWANNLKSTKAEWEVKRSAMSIYWGIAILAFLESVVVLLQCVRIIPVPNNNFLCTGTWINPNVTAMFLALSIFSILFVIRNTNQFLAKHLLQAMLIAVVLAVALLQSRSAYIATAILLFIEYRVKLIQLAKSYFKFSLKGVAAAILVFTLIQILISVFSYKSGSTLNRMTIWENSIGLAFEKPLFGHGFGQFEKEYNHLIAQEPNISNDHINMPYNDFLELGVEGGFVAVFLWLAFLISLCKYTKQRSDKSYGMLPLIISFIVIQLTNFGFQAIPAMVIFLLYAALADFSFVESNVSERKVQIAQTTVNSFPLLKKTTVLSITIGCLLFTITTFNLMGAFYENWMISSKANSQTSLKNYRRLNKLLHGHPIYHEKFGDALMNSNQNVSALLQYKMALENTSSPNILMKTGFCYQLLKRYDSSEYYYSFVQNMQPYKFYPRLTLLKLYQQKGDTSMIRAKANEIKKITAKVQSKRVWEIKRYADSVLLTLNNRPLKIFSDANKIPSKYLHKP